MKLINYLLAIAVLLTLTINISKAEGINNTSKESDLAYQMKQEIKYMMSLPVYLKFEDKNLTGEAAVTVTVKDNGKICLIKVDGENIQLNRLVESKVKAINAWTSTEFAGKMFTYKINMN
jgi:hypothetical protein